jgi:hypothetical protein
MRQGVQGWRMSKGIAITITRKIETRKPYPGERWHRIWNGCEWATWSSKPRNPSLASVLGHGPEIATTRIEFLPPGVVSFASLQYKRSEVYKAMVKNGVICGNANDAKPSPSPALPRSRQIKEIFEEVATWREKTLASVDPEVRQLLADIGWA